MTYKTLNLPNAFIQNMMDVYGEEGQIWLDELPQSLQDLENIWQLESSLQCLILPIAT